MNVSESLEPPGGSPAKTLGARRPGIDRLTGTIAVALIFEASMYSAITPLLPHFASVLHLSKPDIGVLSGVYAGGLLLGSLLGGWQASRQGAKITTITGLSVLGFASIVFGLSHAITLLDLSRLTQGTGAGMVWSGGLAWLIAIQPAQRRGRLIGAITGAAMFGTVLGPALGVICLYLSSAVAFGAIAAILLFLALSLTGASPPLRQPSAYARNLRTIFTDRAIIARAWVVLISGGAYGVMSVLLPLRLDHLHAGGLSVGLTFVLASGLASCAGPLAGRTVDRFGVLIPNACGWAFTLICLVLFSIAPNAVLLAGLIVLCIGGSSMVSVVASWTMLSDAGDRAGLPADATAMMLNLWWAFGEAGGALVGAGLAALSGDFIPFFAVGVLGLGTSSLMLRGAWRAGCLRTAKQGEDRL